MNANELTAGSNVHFVGIGGIGMSWLAELLHRRGCRVTGTDRETSVTTERLARLGIEVAIGHRADAVGEAELVVFTPAVGEDNVEVTAARAKGLPTLRRKELLGAMTRDRRLVAVAGTHGKTTTTGLVASVCEAGGMDPTALVGGVMQGSETNLRVGGDAVWVVEADEYDRAFLELTPSIAVVTSLEADHLDQYGDEAGVTTAFGAFLDNLEADGTAALCVDSPLVRPLAERDLPVKVENVVTYGVDTDARLNAESIAQDGFGSRFTVKLDGMALGEARLRIPGRHNVANALAAVASGLALEISWDAISDGLDAFRGIRRRFEILGEANGVMVVNDYAHHPTEIRATLAAARAGWDGPIVAVFQPHLFSRTRDFMNDFGDALATADRVFVTEIYPAREEPIEGITGSAVAAAVKAAGRGATTFVGGLDDLVERVAADVASGVMVLVMGAGSVERAAAGIWEKIRS